MHRYDMQLTRGSLDQDDPLTGELGGCAYRGCAEMGAVRREAFCRAVLYCAPHARAARRIFDRARTEAAA